jgi:peptidoglycan/LPS O-acetylase OafA/YrhL
MIFIMLIPVVPLFIALGISNPRSAHVTWAFEILGEISYPLYAIHVPILYLATLAWNSTHGLPLSPLTTPLPFGAKLILVMLLPPAALLLSRIYDQPARRFLTRAARTMTAAR